MCTQAMLLRVFHTTGRGRVMRFRASALLALAWPALLAIAAPPATADTREAAVSSDVPKLTLQAEHDRVDWVQTQSFSVPLHPASEECNQAYQAGAEGDDLAQACDFSTTGQLFDVLAEGGRSQDAAAQDPVALNTCRITISWGISSFGLPTLPFFTQRITGGAFDCNVGTGTSYAFSQCAVLQVGTHIPPVAIPLIGIGTDDCYTVTLPYQFLGSAAIAYAGNIVLEVLTPALDQILLVSSTGPQVGTIS